uniref:Uncharacterized protein n=1 Tax=Anguilla anguilla TaxID=7936 RepID=A0A0E9UWX7_ANGAN
MSFCGGFCGVGLVPGRTHWICFHSSAGC